MFRMYLKTEFDISPYISKFIECKITFITFIVHTKK